MYNIRLTILFFMILLVVSANWCHAQKPVQPRSLSATELAAASQLSKRVSEAEWLGPLAPIALSPFFGIACLSGMALFGGDWIPGSNALLQNPLLKSPGLFWTFAVLAVLTSLPKLTKISKPIGQILDQIEAYAGIITLLVIRYWSATDTPDTDMVVQLGMVQVSLDVLLAIAAAINIFVVNSVKFFFELLIWITPIPFLDACFEFANKTICAALLSLYAYSPTIATAISLTLLVICIVAFRWLHRHLRYYRKKMFKAFKSLLMPNTASLPST